jgi:CubicO group peptidase (beta-lactamase class C family)
MSKYKITGLSIAVINNYKVEWAKGYGFADVSEKRHVTEKTLFQAASISKSLNATGILKLAEEKKIDLDRDINDYLLTWKFPYDEKSGSGKITLRHLLSHTGGLTIHGFPGYAKGEELPSVSSILDGKKPANTEAVRSLEEPGKKVIYSGGGTTITQMIVTDVTKQPYELFMKNNVLDPLGMTSSSYQQPPSEDKHDILATGYKADGSEVRGKFHIYPEQAAAGLWTNPSDLARFIIETQLAYKGESAKVLSQEMTKLRLTPVLEDAALGVFVNSRVTGSVKYFNHNGGNEGFSCTAIGSLGEGKGVVIMTNSDNGGILEEIANSVATVYNWKDYYLPESKKITEVDTSVLYKYIGKYDVNGYATAIMKDEDGLAINPFSDVIWKLNFTSDSDAFVREFHGTLRFNSDRNKKVTALNINGLTAKKLE